MTDALIPDPTCPTPAFAWRGFMLDSARTCWSVPEIHELIDLLARYRFNRLHWHLTDDAGWRFQVPGYERLTTVAARLPRQQFLNYDNVDPAKRDQMLDRATGLDTSGYYTDDDIAEILEHARRVGIAVVPEVDLPGHMAAAIQAYPHLGNPTLPIEDTSTSWDPARTGTSSTPNDLLWPTDEALHFIATVVDRVIELFEPDILHIGADECIHSQWATDPDMAATLDRLGLAGYSELQGWFTAFARARITSHGCRTAVWDEATETPLEGGELIFGWREEKGVPAAVASGHEWIYADADELYLNRLQGSVESEPAGMYGAINLRTIWDITFPESSKMLGVQAAIWAEYIADRETLHYHLFPRLLAVAEVAWCGRNRGDFDDFLRRVAHELEWLSDNGISHRPLDLIASN